MGVREKVSLLLITFLLIQIVQESLSRRLNEFKVPNSRQLKRNRNPAFQKNNLKLITPQRKSNSDKQTIYRADVLNKAYDFPDIEYPLTATPRVPFYFRNKEYLEEDKIPQEYRTCPRTSKVTNDFKKDAKLRRRLQKSQTKIFESSPTAKSLTTEPYIFRKVDYFPEVEYPLRAVDTWIPKYWNNYLDAVEDKAIKTDELLKKCSKTGKKSSRQYETTLLQEKLTKTTILPNLITTNTSKSANICELTTSSIDTSFYTTEGPIITTLDDSPSTENICQYSNYTLDYKRMTTPILGPTTDRIIELYCMDGSNSTTNPDDLIFKLTSGTVYIPTTNSDTNNTLPDSNQLTTENDIVYFSTTIPYFMTSTTTALPPDVIVTNSDVENDVPTLLLTPFYTESTTTSDSNIKLCDVSRYYPYDNPMTYYTDSSTDVTPLSESDTTPEPFNVIATTSNPDDTITTSTLSSYYTDPAITNDLTVKLCDVTSMYSDPFSYYTVTSTDFTSLGSYTKADTTTTTSDQLICTTSIPTELTMLTDLDDTKIITDLRFDTSTTTPYSPYAMKTVDNPDPDIILCNVTEINSDDIETTTQFTYTTEQTIENYFQDNGKNDLDDYFTEIPPKITTAVYNIHKGIPKTTDSSTDYDILATNLISSVDNYDFISTESPIIMTLFPYDTLETNTEINTSHVSKDSLETTYSDVTNYYSNSDSSSSKYDYALNILTKVNADTTESTPDTNNEQVSDINGIAAASYFDIISTVTENFNDTTKFVPENMSTGHLDYTTPIFDSNETATSLDDISNNLKSSEDKDVNRIDDTISEMNYNLYDHSDELWSYEQFDKMNTESDYFDEEKHKTYLDSTINNTTHAICSAEVIEDLNTVTTVYPDFMTSIDGSDKTEKGLEKTHDIVTSYPSETDYYTTEETPSVADYDVANALVTTTNNPLIDNSSVTSITSLDPTNGLIMNDNTNEPSTLNNITSSVVTTESPMTTTEKIVSFLEEDASSFEVFTTMPD